MTVRVVLGRVSHARSKGPLIEATIASGWTWAPVTRRAHLTAGRALA